MKKTAIAALAVTMICVPASAQDEQMTVEEYIQFLISAFGKDAIVTSAEVYATNEEETLYSPFGAVNMYSTAPLPETPACGGADFIQQITVNNVKYVWCYSHRVNYEARRDTYISQLGAPFKYYVTAHYDCQILADKNAMPALTKSLVC